MTRFGTASCVLLAAAVLACGSGVAEREAAAPDAPQPQPSASAAAPGDQAPTIGNAAILDLQDLGGVEQGPGSGLEFYHERDGVVVCYLLLARAGTTNNVNRLSQRLEAGDAKRIALAPGNWSLRAEDCERQPLLSVALELRDGQAKSVTLKSP